MVRKWKEEFSYVSGDAKEQMVELSVEGKKQVVDIGDLVKDACGLIISKVGAAVKSIVATADPEYQPILRNNIILSGGGSLISGIADGNGEFTKAMDLEIDYSENFMGTRCKRFALIANNNVVETLYVEKKGEFLVSSAEYVLENFFI